MEHTSLSYMPRLCNLVLSQKKNLHRLSVLLIANFLVAGLGFLTKIKIANTLSKADFGLFAYGFAIAAYGAAVISFGLDRTLVRDLIHFPKKQGQLVASSLLLRGSLFVLVIIVVVIWKFFFTAESDLTWGVVLIVIGQSMMGLELKSVYDSWGEMNRHALFNLIQRCIYFAAIWLTILIAPKYFSVFSIGIFLLLTFSLYMILQGHWAFKRIDFSGIKNTLLKDTVILARGNLIIWFSCMGTLLMAVFNQLVLKYYAGLESLGNYAAAWQIVAIVMVFLTQVARIGNPATARITRYGVNTRTRVKFLLKYSAVMSLIASPVSLAMIICPKFLLGLIYKPEYASASAALRIMGFYVFIFALGTVASQYVISLRKDKAYFASIICGGIISIILCFTLIPSMKDVGAITALLTSHSVSIAIYVVVVLRHLLIHEDQNAEINI